MPKTSLKAGVMLLLNTIHLKLRHQDYDTVTALKKKFETFTTGEGIDLMLKQYNPRENDVLFDQRKKFTKSITKDLVGGCTKPMNKVGRTPATKQLQWKDKSETDKKKKEVEEASNSFYGELSVDKYLTDRMVELDTTDPNSFIVVEFVNEEGENQVDSRKPGSKAMPYPFEISSEEAINYIYRNNTLQWLIAEFPIQIRNKDGYVPGCEFLMYFPINSLKAVQIHKDLVDEWKLANAHVPIDNDVLDATDYKINTLYLYQTPDKEEPKYYILTVYQHDIPFVPARRVGIVRDLTTRGRTVLPLIHMAEPYLEKSVKSMSEFDLTSCLHTFPQKIQYSDPCPGYMDEKNLVSCLKGFSPSGQKCQECHGSGYKYHQSAQDMIQIRMPKDPKDMVSLENVIAYKNPPIDFLEFMKKFNFYELRYFAQKAVYNSENFSKDQIAKTATEATLDLDSVYDTLTPWADNWSGMWTFIYKSIASLRNVLEGATITHTFPKDFKMKGLSLLLQDLKFATDNGAPSHIKKQILADITYKIYADNPEEVLKVNTKEKFFPFGGKTETEVASLMLEGLVSKENKVLYANFELIFNDLEYDASEKGLSFYDIEEKAQRVLIMAKIKQYTDKLDAQEGADAQSAFNAAAGNAMLEGADTTKSTAKPTEEEETPAE